MELIKSRWTTDGDTYTISMPLSKIDKESRLVSGWASLDNPDLQGDIVLAEASEGAFKRFQGNIREMHQPIAVGRMVSWKPDSYYDTLTSKFYSGIYVTVRVSKGAQDTWEKVLDGTLQAFSIHGPIIDSVMEFSKDAGRPLRIIKSYDLDELSLVDAGGNQLANVMSIAKVNGEYVLKGMVADNPTENVFYCNQHDEGVAKTSTEDSAVCPDGHTMQNIGWFEFDGSTDKASKVAGVVDGFTKEIVNDEGGVNVADTKNEETVTPEVATEVAEETVVENAETNEEAAVEETEAETAEATPEVEDEPNFEKMFGDLQSAVTDGLSKQAAKDAAAREELSKSFETKFTEMHEKLNAIDATVTSLKTNIDSVEKRLGGVESDTAVKKSGDLGGSEGDEVLEKSKTSMWGGSFLNASELDQ